MRITSKPAAIPEVDMTPMIDIVFQLIAFFMIAINFEQTKADERVKLPKHELAKPSEIRRDKELVLNIGYQRTRTGEIIGDPARPLVFYSSEQVPVLEMGPALRREQQLFEDLGTDAKDVTVVIRADAEVPTGLVQEIIRLAQEEGQFEKFSLKATQKSGP
ncbi:MAG: ExbD/TolR family protein [Planctomycetaceae bacterium]